MSLVGPFPKSDMMVTPKRILVVEDELIVAADLRNLLRHLGHLPIGQASSGLEAIRMAAESRPDLILMDIRLEGELDGIETSSTIARTQTIPIIYLTANTDRFIGGTSQMVFPFLCVAKPFSAATVQAAIESLTFAPPASPDIKLE
jgi:CheY-like chemotaxis protein